VLQGSIQLLQSIEARHEPADRVIHAWMKSNHKRFDAREREALIQTVEDCLRQRARLDWWIERHGRGEVQPEAALRVAALKILANGSKAAPICKSLEWGEGSPLAECLKRLEGHTLEHPDMPDAVRFNVPAWIMPRFEARFGADLPLEMAAALRPAPLDLRVNALKTSRAAAAAALAAEQQRVAEMPISPWGLRLGPQSYVNDGAAFAEGLIEPQDEGSQIASLLVDAGQARLVVDFCAGAGGKTLAVAATMRNNGRLIACDVSEKRLARAKQRLRRAGVHNAECRLLDAKWVKRQAGMADRVLVDAPCSGTGTWRRKPDARWRLTETDIRELVVKQADILARASRLVAPGGRLIYVTCSVLIEENEAQVTAFLAQHPDFTMLPVAEIWPQLFRTACPASQPWLQLTPGRHGTDGFFVAVMVRKKP